MKRKLALWGLMMMVGWTFVRADEVRAFVGAKLIDGTGAEPMENAVMVVEAGRVVAVGDAGQVAVPAGARVVDVRGKVIMPGLINAHGHVGMSVGLKAGDFSRENVLRDLRINARYGVTTVVSLGGGGQPSIDVRNEQNQPRLDRARLFVAGQVVTGSTPMEAMAVVDENRRVGVDFIKIKVDGDTGSAQRMAPEVFSAVIDHAHQLGLPVASHLYYLEDARALVAAGTDMIAHSIRDQIVDEAFITMVKEAGVYYCPTLMRDVSTFIYESEPAFLEDPFFRREVGEDVLAELRDPARQVRIKHSRSAQTNKVALRVAWANLKKLADAGVPIVMGTDSGPPSRFVGYFEHLEMEMMAREAGLEPMQVIVAATGVAARELKLAEVGTLEEGKWADFLVLAEDPLVDMAHTRSLESVWIAGNRVPEK